MAISLQHWPVLKELYFSCSFSDADGAGANDLIAMCIRLTSLTFHRHRFTKAVHDIVCRSVASHPTLTLIRISPGSYANEIGTLRRLAESKPPRTPCLTGDFFLGVELFLFFLV
eukprot:m.146154 g.146154  ORF g.146154 m.146154 type:complete len:114 (+) comp52704_c0_seq6:1123-1464(+)